MENKPVVDQVGLQEIASENLCPILWEYQNIKQQTQGQRSVLISKAMGLRVIRTPRHPLTTGRRVFPDPQLSTIIIIIPQNSGPSAVECLWARAIKGDAALSIPFFDAKYSADAPPVLSIDCKDSRRSEKMRNIM